MFLKKIFAFLILAAGLGLGFYSISPTNLPWNDGAKKLNELWNNDLEYLKTLKGFPMPKDISEVRYHSGSPHSRSLLYQVKPNIQASGKGQNHLDVFLVTWKDEKGKGVLIQYEYVVPDQGGTIWEFSRTFTL